MIAEHEYLSDEELLTLQAFPLGWYLYGTRMQRAFQIGSDVPPVLARAMGQALFKACRPTNAKAVRNIRPQQKPFTHKTDAHFALPYARPVHARPPLSRLPSRDHDGPKI